MFAAGGGSYRCQNDSLIAYVEHAAFVQLSTILVFNIVLFPSLLLLFSAWVAICMILAELESVVQLSSIKCSMTTHGFCTHF